MKDLHDPREFQQFVKVDDDGTIVAVVESTLPMPTDAEGYFYVDITDLHPFDVTGVKLKKATVTKADQKAARAELRAAKVARG
jgi:hypothetical protein